MECQREFDFHVPLEEEFVERNSPPVQRVAMSTAPMKPVTIVVMPRVHRSSWAAELRRSTVPPNLIGELLLRSVSSLSDSDLGVIPGLLTYQEYGYATGSGVRCCHELIRLRRHSSRSGVFNSSKYKKSGVAEYICCFFLIIWNLDFQLLSVVPRSLLGQLKGKLKAWLWRLHFLGSVSSRD